MSGCFLSRDDGRKGFVKSVPSANTNTWSLKYWQGVEILLTKELWICSTGDGTQGLMQAKQVLTLSNIPKPFYFYFESGSH